ncbi:MAG: hypothetical protein MRJ93_12740 [Nitrososphaeraceae archaeon]|nr:hypothetical protein [Nitrososphaeraceae archaeon]
MKLIVILWVGKLFLYQSFYQVYKYIINSAYSERFKAIQTSLYEFVYANERRVKSINKLHALD